MLGKTILPALLLAGLTAGTWTAPTDPGLLFALSKSVPEADAALESPAEIKLWFTEVPEEGTTSIRLIDMSEDAVDTGDVVQDEDDGRAFSVALHEALPAGTYTVAWRAMGADGHVVRDTFAFTVTAQ